MLFLVVAVGVEGAAGCVGTGEPATGSLSVNLVGQAPSGAIYRLRDATVVVTGPGSTQVFNTEDNPDRTSLSANVVAGVYSAQLNPGFRVERVQGTSATTIPAELISPNPSHFTVAPQQRTTVPLRFRVNAEDVDMTQGYDIVLEIEEVANRELFITNSDGGHGGVPLVVLPARSDGEATPLRALTGAANKLSMPRGVAVAGNEIFVVDQGATAISVFPRDATGEASPIRRIAGPSTQLDTPGSVLVHGGELYVALLTGAIVVFPQDASGDVAPTRMITKLGGSCVYLAIKDGSLYVSNFFGTIRVLPASTNGPAVPTRIIDVGATSATGVAIVGDELFVSVIDDNTIHVFAAGATGSSEPLRLIELMPVLGFFDQLAVLQGELYVPAFFDNAIYVYPASASGITQPVRRITAGQRQIFHPVGVFLP